MNREWTAEERIADALEVLKTVMLPTGCVAQVKLESVALLLTMPASFLNINYSRIEKDKKL